MHAPASLDSERASWTPVVYLNIIKAVRMILDMLANYSGETYDSSDIREGSNWELANARLRLSALVGLESGLASRLSQAGGVTSSDAKGRVFVRKGWQKTVRSMSPTNGKSPDKEKIESFAEDPAAKMLISCKVIVN